MVVFNRTDFVFVKFPPDGDEPVSIPEPEENERHLKLTTLLFSLCGVVAGVIHGL